MRIILIFITLIFTNCSNIKPNDNIEMFFLKKENSLTNEKINSKLPKLLINNKIQNELFNQYFSNNDMKNIITKINNQYINITKTNEIIYKIKDFRYNKIKIGDNRYKHNIKININVKYNKLKLEREYELERIEEDYKNKSKYIETVVYNSIILTLQDIIKKIKDNQ